MIARTGGKIFRLMLMRLPNFIPDPSIALGAGVALGAIDSFLLERIAPGDAVLAILGKEYSAMFRE